MKYPDVFFRSLATPIVFTLIALGFHFFLRGHNAPGGGFIAGLLIAVAALLGRMARDLRLLRIRSETLVPFGLLLAVGTGIAPMLLGEPFLRSAHGYLTLPLIGRFEWSTAVLFDAGVFLVVVGTTITIIDLLAEEANLRRLDVVQEEVPDVEPQDPDAASQEEVDEPEAGERDVAEGDVGEREARASEVEEREAGPPRGEDG